MTDRKNDSVSEEIFDDFLAEQGILEACDDQAVKEIVAEQLAGAVKTHRRQLDRLRDRAVPPVTPVTPETLRRAAEAVGRARRVEVQRARKREPARLVGLQFV